MMYDYFPVTDAHEAALDYSDLFRITSHGDDIQEFDTSWDEVVSPISELPNDIVLQSVY